MMFFRSVVFALVYALAASTASAQSDFPNRPVRIVVPYAPGGVVDIAARSLRDLLAERWNQSIVVENRPGAATVSGTNMVATSPPDGHTMLLVATPFLVNPSLQPNLPYDTLRDLTGVSMVVAQSVALLAHPSVAANNLRELVDEAKRRPEPFAYGSSGTGGISHLIGEMLARTAGIKLAHIPYNGASRATIDVLAGHIPLIFDPGLSAKQFVLDRQLKIIAVSSKERLPILPDVPTFNETYPGFEGTSVQALIAPSATPKPLLAKISADVQAIVRSPEFAARVKHLDLDPVASTPDEFNDFARREIEKWAVVVRDANIKGN
jgi:tripartite-type tricarboxylate transporter receptor subunit TctC